MGTQQNQEKNKQKWWSFAKVIAVGVSAVFDSNAIRIKTDKPVYTDPKGRRKIALEAEPSQNGSFAFAKLPGSYYELNLRLPKTSWLGRWSEPEPFQTRKEGKSFDYCFLRIQPGKTFESIYIKAFIKGKRSGEWFFVPYKISVKELAEKIEVYIWPEPSRLPDCLQKVS